MAEMSSDFLQGFILGMTMQPLYVVAQGDEPVVETKRYLYKAGDECTALTGGWNGRAVAGSGTNTGSFTKSDDRMVLVSSGSNAYCFTIAETAKAINFAGYDKLKAEVVAPSTNSSIYCDFGISTNPVNDMYSNTTKVVQAGKSNDMVTLEIDITGYQGSYYVDFLADVGITITVFNVWLEKMNRRNLS